MYKALSTYIGCLMLSQMHACKSCGVLSRNSEHNLISCPDPKRIESFLRDIITFSEIIQCGDQVCYPCYKFFN